MRMPGINQNILDVFRLNISWNLNEYNECLNISWNLQKIYKLS